MATVQVGMREFRDNMASYVLDTETSVAITRHGDTIGYFIPARRKRSERERQAFEQAAAHLDEMIAKAGLSEDELIEDFKQHRAAKKR